MDNNAAQEDFNLALDSILDKMLLFLHINCIETLRNQPNYMTSKGRGAKKYVVDDGEEGQQSCSNNRNLPQKKNIYELIHDFFPRLGDDGHHAEIHGHGIDKTSSNGRQVSRGAQEIQCIRGPLCGLI